MLPSVVITNLLFRTNTLRLCHLSRNMMSKKLIWIISRIWGMKVHFILVHLHNRWKSYLIRGLHIPGYFLKSVSQGIALKRTRDSRKVNHLRLNSMIKEASFFSMVKVPLLGIHPKTELVSVKVIKIVLTSVSWQLWKQEMWSLYMALD